MRKEQKGVIMILTEIIIIFFVTVMSFVLISGRGSWFVAGYNTLPEKEQAGYNKKRLCKTVGWGLLVIDIVVIILFAFKDRIPDAFHVIAGAVIFIDVVVMLILSETFCRKFDAD